MKYQISFEKLLQLILKEERAKIRKYYMDTLGKATADMMDTYVETPSEILTLFAEDND